MLEHTFIHLPNFGPWRERRLWMNGITTWDDFLEHYGSSQFHKMFCTKLASSKNALHLGDAEYFANNLPSGESWRAFPHFNKVAYLDIETTGLGSATDYITVIGVYDGEKVYSYIHGQNLDDFVMDIQKYDAVVTFNGAFFDLPFIRKSFTGVSLPKLHVDLRFALASLNVTGGLKKIETKFGFEREDDLKGLNGYDAVRMWQSYLKTKDKTVLDRLVRYNAADISNLKKLMEWTYTEKRLQTGFDELVKLK
ncbi:RNase_H superfamily protein [Candidatus Bilamarchaeum dharawalense]|uniref:RNase_H superfamily protein n=1 Tax=Candidatus Bilamarchaeum dharawalense TaxID=2885759 RepID=A0A5E4LTA4_9ARCH|nr:RNase_H superfamily protein [Candidatus Bilamarchaeum dharawalense]